MIYRNYNSVHYKNIIDILKNNKFEEDIIDEWGFIEYTNGRYGVDYNLAYKVYDDEVENCSAFYIMQKDEDGVWHTDIEACLKYKIDFNDKKWKSKLITAAKDAFKYLLYDYDR